MRQAHPRRAPRVEGRPSGPLWKCYRDTDGDSVTASRGQRPVACTAILLAAMCGLHAQSSPGRAEAIAVKLQQHYENVQNFEADFTQTISGGVLPTKST